MPKMTLTYGDLLGLSRGFQMLEQGRRTTVDKKDTVRPYLIPNGAALSLASIEVAVDTAKKPFDKRNSAMRREYATRVVKQDDGTEGTQVPGDKVNEYQAAVEELLDQVVTVELPVVKVADLNLGLATEGKAEIPASILKDLHLVLDGLSVASEPAKAEAAESRE